MDSLKITSEAVYLTSSIYVTQIPFKLKSFSQRSKLFLGRNN